MDGCSSSLSSVKLEWSQENGEGTLRVCTLNYLKGNLGMYLGNLGGYSGRLCNLRTLG